MKRSQQMDFKQNPPKMSVKISPEFKTVNVGGLFLGSRVGHLEMLVYSTEIDPKETIEKRQPAIDNVYHVRLVMDPMMAKHVVGSLTKFVQDYEKQYGEIKPPTKPDETRITGASLAGQMYG